MMFNHERGYKVSKFSLRQEQTAVPSALSIEACIYVEDAAECVSWLVRRETRGPGDLENAMTRLEARYGIPYAVLWSLRYQKPKDILVSVYARIKAAREAEVARQKRLLEHEESITHAKTGLGRFIVKASAALDREKDGDLG